MFRLKAIASHLPAIYVKASFVIIHTIKGVSKCTYEASESSSAEQIKRRHDNIKANRFEAGIIFPP